VAQFEDTPFADDGGLVKLIVPSSHREAMRKDLSLLGIQHASLFPDLDGLATELRETFTGL
jgi:hypothetical protein